MAASLNELRLCCHLTFQLSQSLQLWLGRSGFLDYGFLDRRGLLRRGGDRSRRLIGWLQRRSLPKRQESELVKNTHKIHQILLSSFPETSHLSQKQQLNW